MHRIKLQPIPVFFWENNTKTEGDEILTVNEAIYVNRYIEG